MTRPSFRLRPRSLVIIALVAALVAVAIAWVTIAATRATESETIPTGRLPAGTAMGVVELNVRDLDTVQAYYQDAVGLTVLDDTGNSVTLGSDVPILRLTESADAPAAPTEAGLYHSAIRYPDAPALARVLSQIAAVAPQSFQGSADHAVSEAFYFMDPEGNGLELTIDRPRSEWVWENGQVQMGAEALDPNAFMREHLGNADAPLGGADMGHVHLKVGDLGKAEEFYADALGFAVTARSDGALFYASGGYHHHLATNTWQSVGAGARSSDVGLGVVTVTVPDASELAAIAERLEAGGFAAELTGSTLESADPWGNTVRITA